MFGTEKPVYVDEPTKPLPGPPWARRLIALAAAYAFIGGAAAAMRLSAWQVDGTAWGSDGATVSSVVHGWGVVIALMCLAAAAVVCAILIRHFPASVGAVCIGLALAGFAFMLVFAPAKVTWAFVDAPGHGEVHLIGHLARRIFAVGWLPFAGLSVAAGVLALRASRRGGTRLTSAST